MESEIDIVIGSFKFQANIADNHLINTDDVYQRNVIITSNNARHNK